MGFEIPRDVRWEQDGIPFGPVDIAGMKTSPLRRRHHPSWECRTRRPKSRSTRRPRNRYREGGKEEWIELDTVKASDGSYRVEGKRLPQSKFYKFVLATPTTT